MNDILLTHGTMTRRDFSNTTDASARVTIDVLRVGQLIVLCNDPEGLARYREAYAEALAFESKVF